MLQTLTDNGTTSVVRGGGVVGNGQTWVSVGGDLGGGTLTLEALRGSNWLPIHEFDDLEVEPMIRLKLPANTNLRATLAGATSPDLEIEIVHHD